MQEKDQGALSRTAINVRNGGGMQGRLIDRLNTHLRARPRTVVAIIIILLTATFLLDMWVPLGIVVWVGYVVPILFAFWLSPASILLVTLTSALLIVLGLAWSPPGMPVSFAVANRVLGLGLIGIACLFLVHRQASESMLEASERRLEATLDNALDAVIGADAEGRIIRWNPRAKQLFGWESEEVMGRTLTETIIPPNYRERHEEGLRRFRETGQGTILKRRIEMTSRSRHGSEFPVELTVIPLNVSGTVEFIAFLRDISERKQAQEERDQWSQTLERRVSERTEALRSVNEKLQEVDKVRSAFVAIASHEIRTPLTSTLGYVENMLDGVTGSLNERQAQYLRQVKENTTRLTRLINELLDLSLIEAGRLQLHKTNVLVDELIRDVLKTLQPLAQDKSIRLVSDSNAAMPSLKVDRDKIYQAVLNIAQNAIKFTPNGGTVSIDSDSVGEAVRIRVRDTGPGLSEEEIPKVFDKFYTGTGVPGRNEGIGLGLAIAKSLVELHEGSISVRSRPGEGSTFCITLPPNCA
ncbi:MAG TPA: ATP-binding protein [Nitrospiraceae bacterium]|nr:ATP-binding protein [Nitrospiraceae bacterium]